MPLNDTEETLRVAGTVRESVVDGPGFRFVVFAQGCVFGCEGCHNPQSQALDGGTVAGVNELAEAIGSVKLITGVTFSGGEPFLQARAFVKLGRAVRGMGLNLIVFTGYVWEELLELAESDPSVGELVGMSWLIIDGRFVLEERDPSLPFRGSRNQRIIDVARTVAEGEVVQWHPAT